jgi:hypothetical protein
VAEHRGVEEVHRLIEPEGEHHTEFVELVEALIIVVVVAATAWCGYQSARWEGRQAFLYAASARQRVQAAASATAGGQQKLLDIVTFNTWIEAKAANDARLAALYVRRFSPEFKVAFDSWMSTHPDVNPKALPGPTWMPEYHNSLIERGLQLDTAASAAFTEGTRAREIAELYVRHSLLLAMVLVLIAMSQRFKIRQVRLSVIVVAFALVAYSIGSVISYARL